MQQLEMKFLRQAIPTADRHRQRYKRTGSKNVDGKKNAHNSRAQRNMYGVGHQGEKDENVHNVPKIVP